LPQSYRWSSGLTGVQVEPIYLAKTTGAENTDVNNTVIDNNVIDNNSLIGLKLLSEEGEAAWQIMKRLNQSLQEMQVNCSVVELDGEPCLFVHLEDESAAMCRLKNVGVAIAEPIVAQYPF
jgi:hypothetical protein